MQVNLQQKYVKEILACQGTQPMIFDKFHGISLKPTVNYITLDILPNTSPLLTPLLPTRAPGCLDVVVAVPLLVSLIVAVVVAAPLLPLVVTVPFLVAGLVLYLFMGLYYYICLDAFTSVTSVGFILQ